jgi:hypothetical protein
VGTGTNAHPEFVARSRFRKRPIISKPRQPRMPP